jgi:hypothetical protein
MRVTVLCLTAAVLVSGCTKKAPTPEVHSVATSPASSADVYPLANGGAYLVAEFEDGMEVFSLAGDASVRVAGLKPLTARPDVYPLADGNAYLVSQTPELPNIYLLVGATATPVRDAKTMTEIRREGVSAGFAWASYQAERTRARRGARMRSEEEDQAAQDAEDARNP